jgi:hypothetical protein
MMVTVVVSVERTVEMLVVVVVPCDWFSVTVLLDDVVLGVELTGEYIERTAMLAVTNMIVRVNAMYFFRSPVVFKKVWFINHEGSTKDSTLRASGQVPTELLNNRQESAIPPHFDKIRPENGLLLASLAQVSPVV